MYVQRKGITKKNIKKKHQIKNPNMQFNNDNVVWIKWKTSMVVVILKIIIVEATIEIAIIELMPHLIVCTAFSQQFFCEVII